MKKIFNSIVIVVLALALTGCDSYFDTDPADIINSDDYIGAQSEMYSGYLGIISAMQDLGGQNVILNDLRADFMEPTVNAPQEFWDIYYYRNSTTNNWADPVNYYAVIVACNDYIFKMFEYKEGLGENMDAATETNFNALISSAIRTKAWVYLQLAKTYGEAYYFDDPVAELKDLNDTEIFTKLTTVESIVEKCLSMIDNGINGIDGSLSMNWGTWLDPENPTDGAYVAWNYITPDWLCLRSELLLLQNTGYDWVREHILAELASVFNVDGYKYRLNAGWSSNYYRIFAEGQFYSRSSISSIIYDYANNQTNELITFFGKRYPAEYLLRPTTYAFNKYNPTDNRLLPCNFLKQDGDTVIGKYHSSYRWRQPYQSDASIPLYRAHDLHFMLAEAENHLGHWDQARTIVNNGVYGRFPTRTVDTSLDGWDERYQLFINGASAAYPNIGIVGIVGGTQRDFPVPTAEAYELTEEERIKEYDLMMLDEMLLEYPAEGRATGMMLRMARRYNDMSIIADRVVPKYPVTMQEAVRSKIESGEFFVNWEY